MSRATVFKGLPRKHDSLWFMDEFVTLIVPRVSLFPEGNWTELTFAKTSGSITRDTGKNFQWVTSASPSNVRSQRQLRDTSPIRVIVSLVANRRHAILIPHQRLYR